MKRMKSIKAFCAVNGFQNINNSNISLHYALLKAMLLVIALAVIVQFR